MQNFQYLVGDDAVKKCWLVDPAWNVEDVIAQAGQDGYSIEGALISHAHYDHVNAIAKLLAHKDMPLYIQRREFEFSAKAQQTGIFGHIPKENMKLVAEGETLTLGETALTILHTPGHTPGSQCFLVDGKLISGDTLFIGTCGRCDLPGGNPTELFDTLNRKIAKLPQDTVLYPGHNYSDDGVTSTLAQEKESNRFFHAHNLEDFLNMLGL